MGKRGEIEIARNRLLRPRRKPRGSSFRKRRKKPIPAKRTVYLRRMRRRAGEGEDERKEPQLQTRRRKLREEKAAPRRTLQTKSQE